MKTTKSRGAAGAILLAALAVLFSGCIHAAFFTERGSGRVITEPRHVPDFRSVSLSGMGTILITQGPTPALEIEAEDNVMPLLRTEVRNGALNLWFRRQLRRRKIVPTKEIVFHITAPDIQAVEISGAGKLKCKALKTKALKIDLSGAAVVDMGLDTGALDLDAAGASKIILRGRADRQTVDMSGSGAYLARDLEGQTATLTISGAGRAEVNVTRALDVALSGAGAVLYRGDPHITPEISGAGKIARLQE